MSNKTYDDFADAFYNLKIENSNISYGKISLSTGILESTINALVNRKRANPPSNVVIKKIADFFKVKPQYFYEYRLRQLLEYIDNNREFLDYCLKQSKNYLLKKNTNHKKYIIKNDI